MGLHGARQQPVLGRARARCVGSASSVRLCWPCRVPGRAPAGFGRPPTIATETSFGDAQMHPTPGTRRARDRRRRRGRHRRGASARPRPSTPGEEPTREPAPGRQAGRIARSTAFFSVATAASRVAGLGREIVAASYFGVSGPMSAFTIAFQVPNLIRSLFADAALQPAFVPIFTEQLEKSNYSEAFRLASTLLLLVTMVLGAITALFVLARAGRDAALRARLRRARSSTSRHPLAGPLPDPDPARGQRRRRRHPQQLRPLRRLRDLAAVLEPDDHRSSSSCSSRCSTARTRSTPTRSGSSPAPLVQLADPGLGPAQHARSSSAASFDWRNPGVRRVLLLMLPVTISLGLINFNLLINSFFGSLVSDAGAGGDRQGLPHLPAAAGDLLGRDRDRPLPDPGPLRQRAARSTTCGRRWPTGCARSSSSCCPAAAAILALSEPMIRLVYQRGEFDPAETDARRDGALLVRLLAADQRPLPAADPDLLQPPAALAWRPRSGGDRPGRLGASRRWRSTSRSGSAGSSPATGIGTTAAGRRPGVILRRELGGLELGRLLSTAIRIAVASAALAGVSYGGLGAARRGARARPRRPDRLARRAASRSAALVYLALAQAAADRRARPDHAPAAARR